MTRHSPAAEVVPSESVPTGVHANYALLSAFSEGIGKEVVVELADGSVYNGLFAGVSSDMDLGLFAADERTAKNAANLLPLKDEMTPKRSFQFKDVICITFPLTEEKSIKGFATDRAYHSTGKGDDHGELEEWIGEGEDVDLEAELPKAAKVSKNGGWGVNEMFARNEKLGVTSTYDENLEQYTNAPVAGNDLDRRRADEIARQIEGNANSKVNAALENDDEERDLDKLTEEFELEDSRRGGKNSYEGVILSRVPSTGSTSSYGRDGSGPGGGGSSVRLMSCDLRSPPYSATSNGRRKDRYDQHPASPTTPNHHAVHNTYLPLANRGRNIGQGGTLSTNRRAEGLKEMGARRGSGSEGRGGSMAGGGSSGRGGGPAGGPRGGANHWQQGGQGQRKHDDYNDNSWQSAGAKTKTYENTAFKEAQAAAAQATAAATPQTRQPGQQPQKTMLENRPNASPRAGQGQGPPMTGAQMSKVPMGGNGRIEGLQKWGAEFSNNYRPNRPEGGPGVKMSPDSERIPPEPTPSGEQGGQMISPPQNAWQRGPPTGLVAASPSKSDEVRGGAGPKMGSTPPAPTDAPSPSPAPSSSVDAAAPEKTEGTDGKEENRGEEGDGKKKFSFNPDAPSFTPTFKPTPSYTPQSPMGPQSMGMMTQGGMGGGATMGQQGMVSMGSAMHPHTGMPVQTAMGMQSMAGGAPAMYQVPSGYAPSGFIVTQQGIQVPTGYTVIHGGSIMPGAGGPSSGGPPSMASSTSQAGGPMGNRGMGPSGGPSQMGGPQGAPPSMQTRRPLNTATPQNMSGMVYAQQQMAYQPAPAQQAFMQPGYYPAAYPMQGGVMQGYIPVMTSSGQQGMMAAPTAAPGVGPTHQQRYMQAQQQGQIMMAQGAAAYGGQYMPQQPPPPTPGAGGQGNNANGSSSGGSNGHAPSQPPTPGPTGGQGGPPTQGPQGGQMLSQLHQMGGSAGPYMTTYMGPTGPVMYTVGGGPMMHQSSTDGGDDGSMGGGAGGPPSMAAPSPHMMHPQQYYAGQPNPYYQQQQSYIRQQPMQHGMPPHQAQQQQN